MLICIVYCIGSSGIIELFICYLNLVCLICFVINLIFINVCLLVGGVLLSNWVGVVVIFIVVLIVKVINGFFGYVSLDVVNINSNVEVFCVNGNLLIQVNVFIVLGSVVLLVSVVDCVDFSKWVLVFVNLIVGYFIVGYINFVFGQCYKDVSVFSDV